MGIASRIGWIVLALVGAAALGVVATARGEAVNAVWIVVAAVSVYLIAYRFYALYLAKIVGIDPARPTPAVRHPDGLDFVPTDRRVLFGHHFAAIAGAGPLVGPVLAAQMGYLPGMLWLLAGVVLAGAVQDFMVLFLSMRRDGRSLGELIRMEMGAVPGTIALFGAFMIMVIILAVLALIVVRALEGSPWGLFTVAATIPLALLMGVYTRWIRPGRIGEVSSGTGRPDPCDRLRPECRRIGDAVAVVHLYAGSAVLDPDRLWRQRRTAAGVAPPRATRLPVDLPQDRRDRRARNRHRGRRPAATHAGADPVH